MRYTRNDNAQIATHVSYQPGTDGLTAIQGIGVVDAPELLLLLLLCNKASATVPQVCSISAYDRSCVSGTPPTADAPKPVKKVAAKPARATSRAVKPS